jgi:tRNA (guanine-N7-)-methyltransferase
MGKKNKQQRIADIHRFRNVFEYEHFNDDLTLKGKWNAEIFGNQNPITLELACGKGEYCITLSQRYLNRNFIGIDIKGPRIWLGAKKALENNLDNVCFLRAYIDHLENFFTENEVDEIWIVFPDPYLKKERKRLTSPKFLDIYRRVMKQGGVVHLKTDSETLYNYTLEVIRHEKCDLLKNFRDVYRESRNPELVGIQTFYEKMHLKEGKTIRYISFRL